MRAFRLFVSIGLVALWGVALAGPGAAHVSGQAPGVAAGAAHLSTAPFAATRSRGAAPSSPAPIQSPFISGYATFKTGSSSASSTFKVPRPTCGASNTGVGPGSFMFAGPTTGETLDGAGVLVQCIGGALVDTPALIVGSSETNFSNVVRSGDTIQTSVSVGGGGTSVSLTDVTRGYTLTQTGADSASDTELIGVDSLVNGSGQQLPVGIINPVTFSASLIGGSALGTQSPTRVILVNGCAVVLVPGGIDATAKIFSVTVPKLTITNLVPTTGPTGANVEIDGVGFNGTTTVKFGAVAATTVTHDSATALHAVVPSKAITGPVTVSNSATPKGTVTSACSFMVAPTITTFTPHSAVTGSTVTLNGSGLTPGAQVKFGTKSAPITAKSATQLKVTVPNGTFAAPISVKTPAGTSTTSVNFVPSLSIQSFAPTSGPFGTVVTIRGIGFISTSAVKFNGVIATTVVHSSSTELRATVPSTATTGPITVTNTAAPTGTAQSVISYTVTPHVAPTISSFTPTSGPVGTSVTITGTSFSGASAVSFGTKSANFTISSATQIKATVPTGAVTAKISVTTAAGKGTSAMAFTVT